jgi:hypothetical protein
VEINLYNHTPSFVVLFSVDSMSKQEREEAAVPPYVSERFYVPGMPGTELRIKDFNTKATLHTCVATAYRGTQGHQWEEQGNPEHYITLNISAVTMANYTHVQFISWEVYTGPNRGTRPWSMNRDGISYTGIGNAVDNRLDIEGQIVDIEERLQFTYKAIEEAHKLAVKHPTTLKVFMAPEFLYRGKGGAYIHDLINGWIKRPPDEFNLKGFDRFPGLLGYLKSFAAENKFNDWLFVFGTAISASFPAIKTSGGWVLDSTKMGEIYNTALIQRGGEFNTNDAYASRKRYISGIDFIKSQYNAKGFALGGVEPADRLNLEPNESNREGSATFTINGINDKDGQPIMFGLEVCLDHAISTPRNPQPNTDTNKWGRIRTADKWVKIQLVPSGGMQLKPVSIRLLPAAWPTPHSYAFNCDGLSTLGANSEWGAHTQIWNGANGIPVPPENQLINANYGQPVSNTSMAKVDDDIDWVGVGRHIYASGLWDLGSGYVRVMQEMPL